jgi:hypothetical protein
MITLLLLGSTLVSPGSRVVIPARFSQVARFGGVQQTSYGAILDTWTDIGGGTSIADLDSGTNNLSHTPNMIEHLVDRLEAPSNSCDNCGSRMKCWLVPPVTGDYEFWIASDDYGSFWLSTDNVILERRCHVPKGNSHFTPNCWTFVWEGVRLIVPEAIRRRAGINYSFDNFCPYRQSLPLKITKKLTWFVVPAGRRHTKSQCQTTLLMTPHDRNFVIQNINVIILLP